MGAETIAFFLFGGDRDDWVSRFRCTRLQWHWLLVEVRLKRRPLDGRRG